METINVAILIQRLDLRGSIMLTYAAVSIHSRMYSELELLSVLPTFDPRRNFDPVRMVNHACNFDSKLK
jgi:hypothetical protein